MADPIPTPEPIPATKTRKLGLVNKKQQKSLAVAEQVSTAATKDEYATTLETGHEIAPDFIAQLAADCATARGGLGQVVEHAVAKQVATGGKTGTKQTLMRAIRKIQAAAKQKYAVTQPAILKDYYIGQKIDANQDTLEQVGTAILDKISPPEPSEAAAKIRDRHRRSARCLRRQNCRAGQCRGRLHDRLERANLRTIRKNQGPHRPRRPGEKH